MDTQKSQLDTDSFETDPKLDALLDEALSPGTPGIPAADPRLAEKVYERTRPMLGQRPVLAKIGPTLWRIAALVAIVVGGAWAVSQLNQTQPANNGTQIAATDTTNTTTAAKPEKTTVSGLAAIDTTIEPGNTRIDEQLDVLALRVDMVSDENTWGSDNLSTNDMIDQAVACFEIDQFNDDTAISLSEEPAFF